MKILFLCISEFSGHKSAMNAVIDSIKTLSPQTECTGLNFFNYIPKKIVQAIDGAYYSVIDKKPGIWSYLRDSKLVNILITPLEVLFCFLMALPFYSKILKKTNYNTIVCTQAFPCSCMCLLKKLKLINSNIIAIVTDYNINPYWIRKNVDAFILPHPTLGCELLAKGIKESKIKDFGIPILDKFKTPCNITALKKQYNINPESFVTLIMGGSLGLRGIEETTASLKDERDMHLIVSTASNKELEIKLKDEYKDFKNITILGFVNNINELMDISDVLVCKPGGLTVAESLAKGLKLITINPIPGQEEKNKDFLVKHNLAFYAKNTNQIKNLVIQEKQKGSYKKEPSEHGFPNSAEHTAKFILSAS